MLAVYLAIFLIAVVYIETFKLDFKTETKRPALVLLVLVLVLLTLFT